MIVFYPRNIGMWREDFDFHPATTLLPTAKTDHRVFYDRDELIGFLKDHGVRLDDPEYPLKITGPHINERLGPDTYRVVQWTLVGWVKDLYK